MAKSKPKPDRPDKSPKGGSESRPDKPPKAGGPYLAAALFCANILEDQQQSLSVIGISSEGALVLPPHVPANVPSPSQRIGVVQNILLAFRTGDSPGKHVVRLVVEEPDGTRANGPDQEIELPPEPHGGVNIKTVAQFGVASAGVHWLDVYLDGGLVTRMPMSITIRRVPAQEPVPAKP